MTSSRRRVAVIGDVGGHLDVLRDELRTLGADPDSGRIPPDLVIIQVGDLIHRGPDSGGVIDLVDTIHRASPSQWVQLLGNHEAHYVHDRVFEWPEELPSEAADRLRAWWGERSMVVAAAFRSETGDYLITHAGLTAGFWRSVLDTPVTAVEAAARLNALAGRRDGALFRTGVMVAGRRPSSSAGPLWAEAARELVPSWFQTRMPFHQIHGHSGITDWESGEMRGSDEVIKATTADDSTRHEVSQLDSGVIIGIDPDHGRTAAPVSAAWISDCRGAVMTFPSEQEVSPPGS
ncbi:metallophosphoesterase [Calidifontibacter terrae]